MTSGDEPLRREGPDSTEGALSTNTSSSDNRRTQEEDAKQVPSNPPEILELYGYFLGNSQYEASGIWSRFNIIISVDVFLFGIVALMLAGEATFSSLIIVVIATAGSLFSLWSMYVLNRLWQYHSHWKNIISTMEEDYFRALGWPTPFSKLPPHLRRKKRSWFQTWFVSYTQPFFLVLFILWTFLAIFFLLVFLNVIEYPGPFPAP